MRKRAVRVSVVVPAARTVTPGAITRLAHAWWKKYGFCGEGIGNGPIAFTVCADTYCITMIHPSPNSLDCGQSPAGRTHCLPAGQFVGDCQKSQPVLLFARSGNLFLRGLCSRYKDSSMKKFVSLVIVASLFLLSGTALAADKAPADQGGVEKSNRQKSNKPRLKFEDCDKGNTGALTFEEAQACFPRMSRERFDAIDKNQDGKITKEELKAHRAAKKKKRKDASQ